MGARGNFRDFEKALNDFSAKALAATDPPADELKKAYAALYEKQFRYSFYWNYVEHLSIGIFSWSPGGIAGDMGKAKNHFGELLGLLPEDKMHEASQSLRVKFSITRVESIAIEDSTCIFTLSFSSNHLRKRRILRHHSRCGIASSPRLW